MCWNKGRLCWKIAKLFYFCRLKKLVRPETFGLYHVNFSVPQNAVCIFQFHFLPPRPLVLQTAGWCCIYFSLWTLMVYRRGRYFLHREFFTLDCISESVLRTSFDYSLSWKLSPELKKLTTNLCRLQIVASPLSFVQGRSAWFLLKGLILRNRPQDSNNWINFVTSRSTFEQMLVKGNVYGSDVLGLILFTVVVNNLIDMDILWKIDKCLPDGKFRHFNGFIMLSTVLKNIIYVRLT